MENKTAVTKHSIFESFLLHLVPGLLAGVVYFLFRGPVMNWGFPSVFALMLAVLLVIIPFELGYLLFMGKKQTGRFTLNKQIAFRESIPGWQYLLWSVLVFVLVGMIFTLLKPVDQFMQENIFAWVPQMMTGLDGSISKSNLWITYIALVILGVIGAPIVEELYFRGYLLPRTPGRFPALLHSFLFALYHFFTPWMIVTRTIGMLPIIFAVKRKNIYIGIIVHILLNSIDAVMGFMFIASMA